MSGNAIEWVTVVIAVLGGAIRVGTSLLVRLASASA